MQGDKTTTPAQALAALSGLLVGNEFKMVDGRRVWMQRSTPSPDALNAAVDALEAASEPAAQEVAEIVGDTRFEVWLSCHEPGRARGHSLLYHKHDMRESYWAGYQERGSLHQSDPAPCVLSDEQITDAWAEVSIDFDDTVNVLALGRAIEALTTRSPT